MLCRLVKAKAEYKPSDECLAEDDEESYITHGRLLHCLCFASGPALKSIIGDLDESQLNLVYESARSMTQLFFNSAVGNVQVKCQHYTKACNEFSGALSQCPGRERERVNAILNELLTLRREADRWFQSSYGNSDYVPWLQAIKSALNYSRALTVAEIKERAER